MIIEEQEFSSEHDNNVDAVADQTNAQIDAQTASGLAKVAFGGLLGAVLGTVAVALANKKTGQDINRTVKSVGNAVKDAASGVNATVKNAVEAVSGVAKGANATVDATDAVQATTEKVNEIKTTASQPVVNATTQIQTPVAPTQPVDQRNADLSYDRLFRLHEERLVVNKKQVKTGEVVIGKHVETHKARISVPLEKERLVIEQIPVEAGKPGLPGEADFDRRELVRMEIYEETPEIQKQPFVREQINVHKQVEHNTFEAEEKIRREELDLDVQDSKKV